MRLPLLNLLAAMALPFALLLLRPRGALAVVAAFAAIGAAVGAAVVGLALDVQAVRWFAARVPRQARSLVLEIEATTPVSSCVRCGGHAAVVALGADDSFPYPWCDATLLPSAGADAALRSAA